MTIFSFPTPYPDELLYSVFARYHFRSGHTTARMTMINLLNYATASAVVDFNTRLSALCEKLPENTFTPEYLMNKHTLFPLYKPFLSEDKAKYIVKIMKDPIGKSTVRTTIGISGSKVPLPEFLKYCPDCVKEDIELYGESYWHRSHQVFGINICHKHAVWLVNSSVRYSSAYNLQTFYSLNAQPSIEINHIPFVGDISWHTNMAKDVYYLLNNDVPLCELEKYAIILMDRGFASFSGKIKQKKLLSAFLDFYGHEFLQSLKLDINDNNYEGWITKFVINSVCILQPIQHILMLNFLNVSVENFLLTDYKKKKPFGIGPWPCLNPVVEHYQHNIISDCDVKNDFSGVFNCYCGFIYKKYPHKGDKIRVLKYGHVWEAQFLSWLQEKIPIKEIAKKLQMSDKNVYEHKKRLTTESIKIYRDKKNIEFEVRRNDYRNQILEAMEKNPNITRGKFKNSKQYAKIYTWLSKRDKLWFNENFPKPIKPVMVNTSPVNWELRDAILACQVYSVTKEIRELKTEVIQVTFRAISMKSGNVALLRKRALPKLPKMREALQKCVETDKKFKIRKVKYIVHDMFQTGIHLTVSKILKKINIGIHHPEYQGYKKIVERELDITKSK